MNIAEAAATAHALTWFKSSYSGAEGGDCVEVASTPAAVHVRDSKELAGPILTVGPEAWNGFVGLASGRTT